MGNGKPSETTAPMAQITWGSAGKRNYNSVKEMGLKGEAQLSHNYFSDVFTLLSHSHQKGKENPYPHKLK